MMWVWVLLTCCIKAALSLQEALHVECVFWAPRRLTSKITEWENCCSIQSGKPGLACPEDVQALLNILWFIVASLLELSPYESRCCWCRCACEEADKHRLSGKRVTLQNMVIHCKTGSSGFLKIHGSRLYLQLFLSSARLLYTSF